jgi:hypothetical protein
VNALMVNEPVCPWLSSEENEPVLDVSESRPSYSTVTSISMTTGWRVAWASEKVETSDVLDDAGVLVIPVWKYWIASSKSSSLEISVI